MKFVLIAIIFITLHYDSSQYDIYSQLFRPYNGYRYVRTQRTTPTMPTVSTTPTMPTMSTMPTMPTTMFRYPQPPAFHYSVYRNFTPENRSLDVSKKTDTNQMQSHLDNLLSRMKSTMMQMSNNQEQSATDQSSKTMNDPNGELYKGKRTRKTMASFRSASV